MATQRGESVKFLKRIAILLAASFLLYAATPLLLLFAVRVGVLPYATFFELIQTSLFAPIVRYSNSDLPGSAAYFNACDWISRDLEIEPVDE